MAPRSRHRRAIGLAAALLLPAAAGEPSEAAVKAAFLPKFARYISLPENAQPGAGEPYYLCVIGRDPFGTLLDRAAASEVIDGHPVAVRRFASADAPAVGGCNLAFVDGANDGQTSQMLATLRRQPTLTITDARVGPAAGMIHFVMANGRVRFTIDQGDASDRGITISSRLLALAVDVRQHAS